MVKQGVLCVHTSAQSGKHYKVLWEKSLYVTSQTGQSKQTGLVRSGFTDLSLDSNELLGVTLRPWRQLHVSQSGTIRHTAYRDTDIIPIRRFIFLATVWVVGGHMTRTVEQKKSKYSN